MGVGHVGCCLTRVVFVAVLGKLAQCYNHQQMFTEAETLYMTLLELLKDEPEKNRGMIASGQACGL